MSWNNTKTPAKPQGKAKWQLPMGHTEKGCRAYVLEGELLERFRKEYPRHSNRRLMQWFGISFSVLQRLRRELGLQKDMAKIHKERARDVKRVCEKNGYYDSLRGRKRPEAARAKATAALRRLRAEGQSPIRTLKEKSPRKYAAYLRRKSEERKELWRKEYMRHAYGLPRQTKLRMKTVTHRMSAQKHLMIKRKNYFADPDHPDWVCYDAQTLRCERMEATARKHGLKVVEGDEE